MYETSSPGKSIYVCEGAGAAAFSIALQDDAVAEKFGSHEN